MVRENKPLPTVKCVRLFMEITLRWVGAAFRYIRYYSHTALLPPPHLLSPCYIHIQTFHTLLCPHSLPYAIISVRWTCRSAHTQTQSPGTLYT